jgi:GNAT superfamily N-acetyltransferase/hypoxanthine phosphoribosyltransferase
MFVHYFSKEQISLYLKDLADRLRRSNVPPIWVALSDSGGALVNELLEVAPDLEKEVAIVVARLDRDTGQVIFEQTEANELPELICGKNVLVFDSVLRTGKSMQAVVRALAAFKPKGICTYAFSIRSRCAFVPSFWAVKIDDHDRAYLLLDSLPNNRLNDANAYLHLRILESADCGSMSVTSTLASMDRITWGDRVFDMCNSESGRLTYLLEMGSEIVGYLTVSHRKEGSLMVDEIAVDVAHQGKGLAGVLMRWAETMARKSRVLSIDLWAIENRVDMYKRYGYQASGRVINVDGERYHKMTAHLSK